MFEMFKLSNLSVWDVRKNLYHKILIKEKLILRFKINLIIIQQDLFSHYYNIYISNTINDYSNLQLLWDLFDFILFAKLTINLFKNSQLCTEKNMHEKIFCQQKRI